MSDDESDSPDQNSDDDDDEEEIDSDTEQHHAAPLRIGQGGQVVAGGHGHGHEEEEDDDDDEDDNNNDDVEEEPDDDDDDDDEDDDNNAVPVPIVPMAAEPEPEEEEDEEEEEEDDESIPAEDPADHTSHEELDDDEEEEEEDEEEVNTVQSPMSDEAEITSTATPSGSKSKPGRGGKRIPRRSSVGSSVKKGRTPSVAGLTIPFRTVKKAMKLDPDTPIVQNEAAIMTTIAAELFLKTLAKESFRNAQHRGRNTIRYEDIAEARTKNLSFSFLETLLP